MKKFFSKHKVTVTVCFLVFVFAGLFLINSSFKNSDTAEKTEVCTISVSCKNILENKENLNPEKEDIVPKDGIILEKTSVSFESGESAFDILKRVTKEKKIHLDFSNNTAYNSVYIKGIANIYELDCGNLSGWGYLINGESPMVASSNYEVKENDDIRFVFTCNAGKDIE